jgi:3-hydroxybutyryl-CoA dehydrogenase
VPVPNNSSIPVGVIGMGLMGTSIATCLLAAGHPVVGITGSAGKLKSTRRRVLTLLNELRREKLLKPDPRRVLERFTLSQDYADLRDCELVVESIIEDIAAKHESFHKIEAVVSRRALIGSNTSSIPVTQLQIGARVPDRVIGLHWAEPAHVTRFMEIICGERTSRASANRAVALSRSWGKEPTLVRRDIRGFITNRIMYALLREAFYLVENGYATPADVDRSLRNDLGYWITFAGPFRFMDLTGVPAYERVMRDLLPELDRSTEVPPLMKKVVSSGALGVSNAKGFYKYTPEQARRWEELFLKFSYEIRALAHKYPEDVGDKPARARKVT